MKPFARPGTLEYKNRTNKRFTSCKKKNSHFLFIFFTDVRFQKYTQNKAAWVICKIKAHLRMFTLRFGGLPEVCDSLLNEPVLMAKPGYSPSTIWLLS